MVSFYDLVPPFELSVARHGSVATVSIAGELDLATAPRLAAAAREHSDAELLVVDMTEATLIDSTAVRTLLEADRACAGSGSRLVLVVADGPVRRVFELCELDGRLAIVTDHPLRSGNDGNGRA